MSYMCVCVYVHLYCIYNKSVFIECKNTTNSYIKYDDKVFEIR